MFDVDKLYTYMYSTKEIDDGNGKSKIVRDNSKSLYNDLLDIHLAVFDNNNPDLYKLILSPNGFGQLKTGNGGGLAAEIDALKTKAGRPQYNYLSSQYQMMKFFNGTSGKAGVGVFSSLAMLNAITQNKGLKYVHTNEELQDIFHVKFGGIESDGSIGLLKTLNNSDYTSKVIEAFQSASVDNEKEQILYKLNINKHTFNVINALALLGFDESVICYFINQPIIEEYVKRASEKDSSLRKFEESLTGDIYGDLIQEFSDKYKTKPDYTATDYGVEDLKKQIETPERDNNETKQRGRDSEFWGKQLALLEKFKSIDDIGLNLQSLMQTVNAESKGLGKTLFGSLDRAEKIDNIDSVTDRYGAKSVEGVLNAGRILYDYDKETGEYILDKFQSKQTNSLNGFVAEYGTTELNRIGEQLLPYNNKIIKSIFGYTSSVLDRKGNSINSNEEFMSETFTKMKSYLFSNTELFGDRFDILNERKRLFLGTSKFIDGKLQVENPSLPEIIAALKTDEDGIANTNALLRQLVPDTRRKSSDMDLLKYTASTGQNLDESELHQAFIALFRESPMLEFKIGNKLHSIDGRTLAEDLIKYVYLSGGTQEAIQFTRYIPIEVLNYMGFSDKLKTIADGFSPSIFGVSLDEKGNVVDSNITEQILQHEPSKVPVKIKGKLIKSNKDNTESGIEDVKTSKNSKGVDVITEFKLILDKDETKSRGEYMNGQKYLAGRLGDSYLIYKKFGDTYQLIPTLGSFGVNEYNYNIPAGQIAKSIIFDRNIGLKDDVVSVEDNLKDSQKIAIDEFNSNKVYDFNKIPEGQSHIEWSLNAILNNKESSDYHKSIAKALVDNDHILKTLSHIPISYSGISAKGKFKFSDDLNDKSTDAIEISDNPKVIINQDYLDRSILHEIQHAYTVKTLRRFDAGDKTLPVNVMESAKRIDTLRRSLRYKFKQNPEFLKSWNKVANYLDPNKANSEQLSLKDTVTYGLMSNEEFVTMATEDPEFRRLVTDAGNGFLNDSNIFTKLWNALLDFLGLNSLSQINKDYVTNEIFQFINTIDESLNNNIEKSKLKEGFRDNEKLRKVEEVLNEIENLTANIVENPKESITFAKSESPDFKSENINFELSSKEQESLIKKHGKNAVEDYNELTNEEKEYIIKCL